MTAFLRAIVANPGESSDEKAHVETIAAEMKKSPRYVYLIRREALAVVYRILEQDGKVA